MNIDQFLNGQTDDAELDALMARVREAAGVKGDAAPAANAPDGRGVPSDLDQVLAAQAAWNDDIAKSLSAIVECLQTLQDAWQELDAYVRTTDARASARAKLRRRPPARVRRGHGAKRNGRST